MMPVILFDGECNLCHHAVQFVLKHERRQEFHFAASQSPAGRRLMEQHGIASEDVARSMYVVEVDRVSSRSTAALRIVRTMRFPWSLAYGFIVVPRLFRDGIYNGISKNRYRWFGRRDVCHLPTPEQRARFLEDETLATSR